MAEHLPTISILQKRLTKLETKLMCLQMKVTGLQAEHVALRVVTMMGQTLL